MLRINKIWFEGEYLCGQGDDGKIYRQSLLWYKDLMNATEEDRNRYEFSYDGIHWRHLDVDVSFESFEYEEAIPSPLQRFFLTHPEINVAGFAKKYGLNATLLRNYTNGFKTPSAEKEREIFSYIHELGKEYEAAGR